MSERKIFDGLCFSFTDAVSKSGNDVTKMIRQNGGIVSYMLTKKVNVLFSLFLSATPISFEIRVFQSS
jgi:hypothetical protein